MHTHSHMTHIMQKFAWRCVPRGGAQSPAAACERAQVWDIRAGHAVRSIFGPHVCGDSVDYCRGVVLTGSWRGKEQMEVCCRAMCDVTPRQ